MSSQIRDAKQPGRLPARMLAVTAQRQRTGQSCPHHSNPGGKATKGPETSGQCRSSDSREGRLGAQTTCGGRWSPEVLTGGSGGAGQAQAQVGSSASASSASCKCGERRFIFHLRAEFNERHDEGSQECRDQRRGGLWLEPAESHVPGAPHPPGGQAFLSCAP